MLYNHPQLPAEDWGVPFDPELHQLMYDYCEGFDIDAHLTPEVSAWCDAYLHSIGFDVLTATLPTPHDRENPFLDTYMGLRTAVRTHILSGADPQFSLLETPTQTRGKYTVLAMEALRQDEDGIQEIELPTDTYLGGEDVNNHVEGE